MQQLQVRIFNRKPWNASSHTVRSGKPTSHATYRCTVLVPRYTVVGILLVRYSSWDRRVALAVRLSRQRNLSHRWVASVLFLNPEDCRCFGISLNLARHSRLGDEFSVRIPVPARRPKLRGYCTVPRRVSDTKDQAPGWFDCCFCAVCIGKWYHFAMSRPLPACWLKLAHTRSSTC